MIIIFFIILAAAGILAGVMLMRSQGTVKLPTILAWLGGIMAMGSFFFLPWINFGHPGTILENTDWLAGQTLVIDALKQLPGLDQLLASTETWTAQDVWDEIDHPMKDQILQISESGALITGWRLYPLLSQVEGTDAFFLIFSMIVASLSIVIATWGMFSGKIIHMGVAISMALLAGVAFTGLLVAIPTLDQLGKNDEIYLRLLMVLAEARVGIGAGWAVTGLFLIVFSNLVAIVLAKTHGTENDFIADSEFE